MTDDADHTTPKIDFSFLSESDNHANPNPFSTCPSKLSLVEIDERWNNAYRRKQTTELEEIMCDDWTGFLPDGCTMSKADALERVSQIQQTFLVYDRQVWQVFGHTGIVRGVMYVNGQKMQSFLRVYVWKDQKWQSACIQIMN